MEIGGRFNVEDRIDPQHPIREIRRQCDLALQALSEHFDEIGAAHGRPSTPPERLLKAKVPLALYSVRSDRMFCERLNYNLLFQWFLDMNPSEAAFDASPFRQNQTRLIQHEVADLFFSEVVELARAPKWVSNGHFTVDGTLIEAWASMKSFKPKRGDRSGPGPGSPWSDFSGQPRKNDTHGSTTDPEAKLVRKNDGDKARLCFGAHAGDGESERPVGVARCAPRGRRARVGGGGRWRDRTTQPGLHAAERRRRPWLSHRDLHRRTARGKDRAAPRRSWTRATQRGVKRNATWRASQKVRKRIGEIFGWMKTTGNFRKSRDRGVERTHAAAQYVAAACNLVRMAKLMVTAPPNLAGA